MTRRQIKDVEYKVYNGQEEEGLFYLYKEGLVYGVRLKIVQKKKKG
jgi:hypothetical protein